MAVKEYLYQEYKRTNWCFFNSRTIINKFRENGRNELNELLSDGYIKKTEGANNPIVEIIPEKFVD